MVMKCFFAHAYELVVGYSSCGVCRVSCAIMNI